MSLSIVWALGYKEYAFIFAAIGSWELFKDWMPGTDCSYNWKGDGGEKELNHSFIDVWFAWFIFILPCFIVIRMVSSDTVTIKMALKFHPLQKL